MLCVPRNRIIDFERNARVCKWNVPMTWRTFAVKVYWCCIVMIFVKKMPWGLHKAQRDHLLSFSNFSVFYRSRKCTTQGVQAVVSLRNQQMFLKQFFILHDHLFYNSSYWAFPIFFRDESCSSSWKNITRCVSNTTATNTLLLFKEDNLTSGRSYWFFVTLGDWHPSWRLVPPVIFWWLSGSG